MSLVSYPQNRAQKVENNNSCKHGNGWRHSRPGLDLYIPSGIADHGSPLCLGGHYASPRKESPAMPIIAAPIWFVAATRRGRIIFGRT